MMWAVIGSRIWSFIKTVPWWIWALPAAAIGLYLDRKDAEAKQRAKDEAKTKLDQVTIQRDVAVARTDIIRKESNDATAALEARDSGALYPTTDSMPDDLKAFFPKGGAGSDGNSR